MARLLATIDPNSRNTNITAEKYVRGYKDSSQAPLG